MSQDAWLTLWETANEAALYARSLRKQRAPRSPFSTGLPRYSSSRIMYKRYLLPLSVLDKRPEHTRSANRWHDHLWRDVVGPNKICFVSLSLPQIAQFLKLCNQYEIDKPRTLGALIGSYMEAVAEGNVKVTFVPKPTQ